MADKCAEQAQVTAASVDLALCLSCHHLTPCGAQQTTRCPRCGASVSQRKRGSLWLTWFYVALAALLFVPANVLPIMTVINFGRGEPSTIVGGVKLLLSHGLYGIAAIVFVASFLVPLGKLLGLTLLLISIQRRLPLCPLNRTRLYRVVEWFGRWSMLDVFVVALLVGLVHLGQVAVVEPGAGALAFGAVVVSTMLAALSFDPRLIWDECEE